MASAKRRLAAILFSDVVGYTALMGKSEAAGLRARVRHRTLMRQFARRHRGKIVDENGDELVLIFTSALAGVYCALAVQAALREDPELKLRIGIHVGDVVFEQGRVYGDGVNVASRLRPLAAPGGVVVSAPVFDAVKNQLGVQLTPVGEHALKNIPHPVAVYAVAGSAETPSRISIILSSSVLRRVAVAAALAIPAAGAFYLERTWRASSPGAAASVVVLPFADMSPGGDQGYFADGMSEEIINTLARIPDLRVVARTSAFTFKGRNVDVRTIGEQLGVLHVVEGSVRRSGERLRVTAQLVSVADGYHVWSETYEGELSDVFAIQENVATKVAEALSLRIAGRSLAQRPARDLRAYDLYLTGRHLLDLRAEESMRRAIDYFEQALALDPLYAPALSGLADALTLLSVYRFDNDAAVIERAREAARAAIRADPSLGAAYASLGRLQYAGGTWNWDEAERLLRRAIDLSPGYAQAHLWYGQVLAHRNAAEGLAEIQRAFELDPLSPVILRYAGSANSRAGDHERAVELLRRAVDLSPQSFMTRLDLAAAYVRSGDEGHAAETVLAGVPPPAQTALRTAYETGGLRALAERLLQMEQERTEQRCPPQPGAAAMIYAYIGDADGVFKCLGEGETTGDTVPIPDPLFAPFRSDPRFAEHLRAIGVRE